MGEENNKNLYFDGILENAIADAEAKDAEGSATDAAVSSAEASEAAERAQEASAEATGAADANAAKMQQMQREITQSQNQQGMNQGLNLNELVNLIATMRQENEQLRAAAEQAQKVNTESAEVAEEAQLTGLLEPPTLDFTVLEYAEPDVKQAAFEEYSRKLADYSREQAKMEMEKSFAPVMDSYKREEAQARENNAISTLSGMAELDGFADDLPQIKAILQNNKTLSGIEPQERYMLGYFLNKGIQSKRTPQKTPDQMADEVMNNPEVMRIIEARRAAAIEAKNADVPILEASRGLASSSVNVNEKPRNFDEARRLALKMAGIQ